MSARATQPVFYYDLGSPQSYIAAEVIGSALPVVPEWEPVLCSKPAPPVGRVDRELIERRARELGLQPLRWPRRWPPDTTRAMLAATYAKQIGRAVAFSLAAFRQEFAAGRDLGEEETVLLAGAASEIHPAALLKGIALRGVRDALEEAVARARRAGVGSVPAIELDGRTFEGLTAPEQAARALGGSP